MSGMQAGLEPEIMIKAISGSGTSRMFGVRGLLMVAARYDEATVKVDMHQMTSKSLVTLPTS